MSVHCALTPIHVAKITSVYVLSTSVLAEMS